MPIQWRERAPGLLWMSIPALIYLFVLGRLWFNAPIWDDYDAVLHSLIRMQDAKSAGEWLSIVFELQNEHRIVTVRLATLAWAGLTGTVDFRILMLAGNLTLFGIFAFIWLEFRDRVPAPALGAAAILALQFSQWEATMMASAGLGHVGAIFFSFGCIYFALRAGSATLIAASLFGIVAVASQANGLLALPVAAAACAFSRRGGRAALLAGLAAIAWALYFQGFARPPHHPSPLAALTSPVTAVGLFLVVVGGIVPATKLALVAGIPIVGGFAWLARKRVWVELPVASAWVVFLMASVAAITAGRTGFGVIWQSRYAIISSCLVMILGLAIFAVVRPRGRRWPALAVAGAVTVSLAVSFMSWPQVTERMLRGDLLKEAVKAEPGMVADRYGGIYYPEPENGAKFLAISADRGQYFPGKVTIHPWKVVDAPVERRAISGHIDTVGVKGSRVTLTGWAGIPATVPGRTMRIATAHRFRLVAPVAILARTDVAMHLRDAGAVFSGFRVELEFDSPAAAEQAAKSVCADIEAPGRPPFMLANAASQCHSPP